ncbi:hypothetical protein SAMN05421781_0868 [Marinococcus luteus]|uniref:Uncharacterized protein n=1 Tax=Marinococcus luteus TaxID=1122204 RepID=A0A1H2RSG5_9BACI|nr:hypothetical protein [Marinococcus luteus]SDW21579.1 hypothetical protein SAMN05421781_0868 [Marinococcus luteus]
MEETKYRTVMLQEDGTLVERHYTRGQLFGLGQNVNLRDSHYHVLPDVWAVGFYELPVEIGEVWAETKEASFPLPAIFFSYNPHTQAMANMSDKLIELTKSEIQQAEIRKSH